MNNAGTTTSNKPYSGNVSAIYTQTTEPIKFDIKPNLLF